MFIFSAEIWVTKVSDSVTHQKWVCALSQQVSESSKYEIAQREADNEVILYEITDEPAGPGTDKRGANSPKRKEAETIPNRRFFSKNNSSCSYNANKMSLYGTGRYFYAFKSIYDGFG